ncbi:MAG: hypothetical protein HC900_05985 [Methylacidiphilales bacterium]|nr:hypothetical protein [Candidatus Methylacidiphilales bacterium]
MSLRLSKSNVLIAAGVAFAVFSHGAEAQSPELQARLAAAVSKIQAACRSDVDKYCSQVTPGEGRLILCMQAHEDKVSGACDYAVYEASRNLQRALDNIEVAADICWDDIVQHCSDVAAGGGRIAQCLASKKGVVTKACRGALDQIHPAK